MGKVAGSRWRRRSVALILLVPLFIVALPAAPVRAATTYYVGASGDDLGTNTAHCTDPLNDDCSLRDAIAAAASGADTIRWEANNTGLLVLVNGTLTLAHSVTILGSGAGVVQVSGGGAARVFSIEIGVTAAISGLTIEYGHADKGGGILNKGSLTVTDSAFAHNIATGFGGGILNDITAALRVTNSTFSSNSAPSGGGIANMSSAVVTSSTLMSNTAGAGGGIYNYRTLTVTDSAILGNTASDNGGGIDNYNGNLTMTNATIAGNTAVNYYGGGLLSFDGDATLASSTIANNTAPSGAGIHTDGYSSPLSLHAVLLANPSGGNCTGLSITSGDNNLASDTSCQGLSGAHDLVGVAPGLDPAGPRDNGGPTRTITLLPDSLAVEAGGACPAGVTKDQRGLPRVGNCDIDAYEYQPVAPSLNDTSGPAGGSATFHGTGFQIGTQLTVAGATLVAPAAAVAADGTTMTLSVPAHAAGLVPMSVTNPGKPAALAIFTFQPAITSLSPPSGSATGGGRVTITGAGFVAGNTSVQFGNAPATMTNVTPTTVIVAVPAHPAGAVDVTITANGIAGTKPSAYIYGPVSALPPAQPVVGTGTPPTTLPAPRPAIVPASGGAPNPLPTQR